MKHCFQEARRMRRMLLVVDDIETNREILKKILGDEYDIIEASDGAEAISVMKGNSGTLSAVLLDLVMPVMNGFEVLARMRGEPQLSHIPVIVTTGRTEDESEVQALSLGANDYITKPYNSTIIKHRIRNMIKLRETAATINMLQRDMLTGLYNREIFFEKAKEMIAKKPVGYYVMASFNIDNFKVINDQYGTDKGDLVLKHVADCLDRCMKLLNGICCRVTADNFAVLYPSEVMDSEVLAKCHQKIAAPECLGRSFGVRIGRYVVTDPAISASAMYDRATVAEMSVKGRYDVFIAQYDESMLLRMLREQEIVNEMNGALAEGQFEIWFQPQFNHSSGALIGAEALVRWCHPRKGLVSPGEFIPVFERNGFVYELDKYVWDQACRNLRKWLDAGRDPLPISVNISRYDLFQEDLLDSITRLVSRYDLPAELLRFEITESAFAGASDRIIDVVEMLKGKGFIVEIDDFGSGYSSLNILKDVPADILKLDMRFLESGRNPARGGNILESVVRMAKWLGMPVIAEGVETIEQAEFLKSIGCYYIQGYLYARPMPLDDYEAFVNDYEKEREMFALKTMENLDNNTFWDPKSLETLIFNSYVGGACIYEYYDGKIELLRINENYIHELGVDSLSEAEVLELDLSRYMDEENKALMLENITCAIQTGKESNCEVCLSNLPGSGSLTYILTAVRVIATVGSCHLLYCSVINMTALREAEQKEKKAYDQMRAVMDDVPGGFCQMQVLPDRTVKIVYVNEGFCKLVDMEKKEVMALYGVDVFIGLHPQDRMVVREAYRKDASKTGQLHIRCRIRHGKSGYIWTMLFGRITQTESGEVFVNAYYTDVTEPSCLEDQRRDQLDNLPCGTALYAYSEGTLKIDHLNKRYRELVGRALDDPATASVLNVVHPADRTPFMEEIKTAIAEKRDIMCTIRLCYADTKNVYRTFQVNGRAVENNDGTFSIYATFLLVSAEEAMLQKLLPQILDAIMDSTTDLSFAKDKDYRYLCGSHPFLRMVGLEQERDLVGKTDYDLFEKSIADKFRSDDIQLMQSGKSLIDILEEIPSDDNVQHYSSTSKYLLRDTSGNIVGLYGVGRDITEYHAAFEQLRFLTESVPCGIASFEVTENGLRNTYFNEGFYNFSGYTKEEYKGIIELDALGLVFKEDIPPLLKAIQAIKRGELHSADCCYRCHKRDGGYRWMSMKIVVSERRENPLVINVVQFDITERKLAEEQLRMSEEQYRIAMKQSGNIMCRYDVQDRSLNMSSEVAAIFGLPEKTVDVPYEPVRLGIIAPNSVQPYIAFYEGIFHGEKTGAVEIECRTMWGWRWLKACQSTVFSDDGEPAYAVISFVDITLRRIQEKEHALLVENERILRKKADIDGLTGIYNKIVTETKIRKRIAEKRELPYALLIADIDDLKKINDTLGHLQGDRAIRLIADIIETQFQIHDIVGRVGGDEFLVFLDGIGDRTTISKLLTSLTERIATVRVGERDESPICVSIGVAAAENEWIDFETLYLQADKALYHVKRKGKKYFSFYSREFD